MPCKGTVVGENTMIAHDTIVSNVAISHYQTVLTHLSFKSVGSSAVNGNTFPDGGVVSNNGVGFLTIVF